MTSTSWELDKQRVNNIKYRSIYIFLLENNLLQSPKLPSFWRRHLTNDARTQMHCLVSVPTSVLSWHKSIERFVQYQKSMDNMEFWKSMFQAFFLQSFCYQGHNAFSYLASNPFSLSFAFSSSQEPSKQSPQSEKALLFSSNRIPQAGLKKKNVDQHLAWLKHSILKTVNRLLWSAIIDGNYSSFQFDENSQEDSLVDYLQKGKSLVPTEMIQNFQRCLALHLGLKKVFQWVYRHAQAKFGDQLILIAHKVLMVYLPLKQNGLSYHQIRSIINLPFNFFNIYNDPYLRILNFSSFCKNTKGSGQLDSDLYTFCVAYIDTILLVLEGYSQNPYFKQIQEQEEGRQPQMDLGKRRRRLLRENDMRLSFILTLIKLYASLQLRQLRNVRAGRKLSKEGVQDCGREEFVEV